MTATLAQLTASIELIPSLRRRYAVGKNGSTRRGRSGDKTHLLFVCNGAGFHVEQGVCGGRGTEIAGLDTSAVTCTKCLGWLAATSARLHAAPLAQPSTTR